MHAYLACFDISDDKKRTRLARHLERYGHRVQYSVFEISVRGRAELDLLCAELAEMVDADDDVRFYALCRQCRGNSRDHRGQRIALYPSAIVV